MDYGDLEQNRRQIDTTEKQKMSAIADDLLEKMKASHEEHKRKLEKEKHEQEEKEKSEATASGVFSLPCEEVRQIPKLQKRKSISRIQREKEREVIKEIDPRELEKQDNARFVGRCFHELRTRLLEHKPFDRTIPPPVLPKSRRGKVWTLDMIIDKLRKNPDKQAETTRAVYVRADRVIEKELAQFERKPLDFLKYINELGCLKGKTKYNTTKSRLAVLFPDIWEKIKDYVPPFSYYEKARENDTRERGYEMHPAREQGLDLEMIMSIEKKLTGYNSLVASLEHLTGCRTSEVPSLLVSPLLEGQLLLSLKGKKHSKDRQIILTVEKSAELYNHLAECLEVGERSPFSDINIGSYRSAHLRERKALGLEGEELRRYAPHSLRHNFISDLREKGYDERDMQKYIGHRDRKSTMQYGI